MPTRGLALFAASKRGQSSANAKERDVGAPRGVGPRCEITEVRREREEMEDSGDERKTKRGAVWVMVMSENKSKNKKGSRLYQVTWRTERPEPTLCRAATRWSTDPMGPDLRTSDPARIPSIYEARIK